MGTTLEELMAELERKAKQRMAPPRNDPPAAVPEYTDTMYEPGDTLPEYAGTIPEAESTLPEYAGTIPEAGSTLPEYAERVFTASGPAASYEKGQTLADTYTVLSDPIQGGMGRVWRVRHSLWNVELAMKRPKESFFQTEKQKADFIGECRVWMEFGLHPNIVACYYVRELDGVPTIFSEWMDGGSLGDAIRSGSLYRGSAEEQTERILDIAVQFARGLGYAHKQGRIHQDVKPDNLMLSRTGDAKVSDFGLARARAVLTITESADDSRKTVVSAAGGYTPAYCSMEQMDGQVLTRRTDIYSWAVSVMEMFVGEVPWLNGVVAGLGCRTYLEETRLRVPERLKALLIQCLNADAEQRPADFSVVERELRAIYEEETGRVYPRPESRSAPDTAESLNNRALSYLDLGNEAEAERFFDAAVAADPRNLQSVYNRALFLWRKGVFTDAEAIAAVEAVAVPGDETGKCCLAMLRGESGAAGELRYTHLWPDTVDTLHASYEFAAGWHQDSHSLLLFGPRGTVCQRPDARVIFGLRQEELGFDGNNCNLALSVTDEKKITVMNLQSGSVLFPFPLARTDVIVTAVALCKRKLAYAMADGEIFLCDIFGRPYQRVKYTEVPGRVSALEYSRDSETLAVGYSALVKSYNAVQSVHVLNASTGELLCTLPLCDSCQDIRVEGDTVTVWSGTERSVWSISTGEKLRGFSPETARAWRSCLSQDGRYVLIARDASVSEIWDCEEGRCVRTVKLPALPVEPGKLTLGEIRAVAFPEGKVLISGDNGVFGFEFTEERSRADWQLCVISDYLKTSRAGAEFEGLLEKARAAAAGDKKTALKLIEEARRVSGFENHPAALEAKAEVYASARRGKCTVRNVFRRAAVTGDVTAMTMDASGRCCAVIRDGQALLLSVPELRETDRVDFESPGLMAISGDGRFLLLASEDTGAVGIYDTQRRCFVRRDVLSFSELTAVDISRDGSLALLQYDLCRLLVFETESGEVLCDRRDTRFAFNTVRFTPDGRHIAAPSNGGSGTEYNELDIFDARELTLTEHIAGASAGGMNSVAFPGKTDNVFTSSWDRHVYLADRKSSRREGLQWHDHAPTALCAMWDGSHVISGDHEGVICIYRVLPSPDYGFTLHSETPADHIRITDNARYMAVLSYGRQAAVYELDVDYELSDLPDLMARLEAEARKKLKK